MTRRDDGGLVCVGVVAGANGVKGEVKIKTFTEQPLALGRYGPLCDRVGKRQFAVKVVRETKGGVVARLEGVNDRDQADMLKGCELFVLRDRLPGIGDDETWYHADLIGLEARDDKGGRLGTVTAVHNFGAGDLIEIEFDGEHGQVLVPFTRAHVPEVDIAKGCMTVHLPEEL